MTALGKRVLTAAVLLPPLVGIVHFGKGLLFALLVGGVVLLCAVEYARLFFSSARARWSGTAVTALVYLAGAFLPFRVAEAAAMCSVFLLAVSFLAGPEDHVEKARGAGLATLGAMYIGGFLSTYPRTIALPGGEHWIFLGFVAVFGGDICAYFVGTSFGKRHLSKSISPNKTIEGAVGGLVASVALGTGYGLLFLHGVPPWFFSLASLVLGIAGQAGDLFESLLKRAAGVKDSGAILPGHGGMFDRADALIAAGPVLYLLAWIAPFAGGQG